jgi:hypothetical protein
VDKVVSFFFCHGLPFRIMGMEVIRPAENEAEILIAAIQERIAALDCRR